MALSSENHMPEVISICTKPSARNPLPEIINPKFSARNRLLEIVSPKSSTGNRLTEITIVCPKLSAGNRLPEISISKSSARNPALLSDHSLFISNCKSNRLDSLCNNAKTFGSIQRRSYDFMKTISSKKKKKKKFCVEGFGLTISGWQNILGWQKILCRRFRLIISATTNAQGILSIQRGVVSSENYRSSLW